MLLKNKQLEKDFKDFPLYSQEDKGENAIVVAKFHNPYGNGNWFITEANKEANGDYTMFGWCDLGDPMFAEYGYVMLSDLENIGYIARDNSFPKGITIKQAKEEFYRGESK